MKFLFKIMFLVTIIISATAFADSWKYENKIDEKIYKYGEISIIHTVDARKDQQYPQFSITIKNKNELIAKYNNVSFDNIFASSDNKTFVALSNDGLPGTAILVFDNEGNLKLEIKHHFGHFKYCDISITRIREWYKQINPECNYSPLKP